MTIDAALALNPRAHRRQRTQAALDEGMVKALRERFPPRQVPTSWPASVQSREEVLKRLGQEPLRVEAHSTQDARRRGASKLLRWLQEFPGESWQERWLASGAHGLGAEWMQLPRGWLSSHGRSPRTQDLHSGLIMLYCADVIRPDLGWLMIQRRSHNWRKAIVAHRDPMGFARLHEHVNPVSWSSRNGDWTRTQIATLLVAKGGLVADITVGDCLELRATEAQVLSGSGHSRSLFYSWLRDLGNFPDNAPPTLAYVTRFVGQATPAQLVERYGLQCAPIRNLIIDYLAERQPALDHNTLRSMALILARNFWSELEELQPGIDSLHLDKRVATTWKERIKTKITRRKLADGTVVESTAPRHGYPSVLMTVRAFYLDIAQWALEDPARWGPWATPCPIKASETEEAKYRKRRRARTGQRTRDRLPAIHVLVQAAETHLKNAQARLETARATPNGQPFTVLGEILINACSRRGDLSSSLFVVDADGRRRDLALAEHRAFWAWAAIEFLRHTGVRLEEMMECTHHSITQYSLPTTGELIPLLQIAPSKTDEERLLVVSPELADVLSAIICRVRGRDGVIPLIPSYDGRERVWNPPMPLLFQWRTGGTNRAISENTIRKAIDEVLASAELTDAAGQPLHFQPHDFRRIFTTDAILNGMPPHIAQLILGHKDINTTMGYKAVYPQEAINGHRAYIARRRALRPSEEYRTPTDEEWEEFLGHFERRKVALGDCGRAYGTSCQHEHSCVRCPLLRVDPAQRRRLEEIRDNLLARIGEAEREGWLGEAEGLRVSLAAANEKLAQLDRRAHRAATINLGMPTFDAIVGRTAMPPAL